MSVTPVVPSEGYSGPSGRPGAKGPLPSIEELRERLGDIVDAVWPVAWQSGYDEGRAGEDTRLRRCTNCGTTLPSPSSSVRGLPVCHPDYDSDCFGRVVAYGALAGGAPWKEPAGGGEDRG